jgi:hypothetical protein
MTKNRVRWSDHDKYWGPFTYASPSDHGLTLLIDSGEEEYPGCRIRLGAFGRTLLISIPSIIKPWKRPISYDGKTFYEDHRRQYGFSYSTRLGGVSDGGFLQIFLGPQTHDSGTTKDWSCFTPWNNWRHVRHSFYGTDGKHFWTSSADTNYATLGEDRYRAERDAAETCPTRTFRFADFDGEIIECKTRIEEREWRLGTGWFKWLSRFKKPIIHRSLDLDFSKETGRRKGSWKGGTTGHSIEMLPGELHEAAFKRYCDGDDRREGKRDMEYIGEVA